MVGIEMQQPPPEFATCWQAAARYLQKQVQRGTLSMGGLMEISQFMIFYKSG